MNKKIFGALLASMLVVSQAVVTFAAPSGTTTVTAVGSTKVEVDADFTETVTEADALEVINVTNTANVSDAAIVAAVNKTGDVQLNVAQANFVTKFVDVKVEEKSADGLYHVEINVPALPANASTSNVRGLHFSVARKVFEVVTPVKVEGDVVEFGLQDCSPITVFVTDAATSPATGVTSNWTLYMGAAVVLLAVSAIASKKVNR